MLLMIGQLAGVKSEPNRYDPSKPDKVVLGIQVPKSNGFPGETIMFEVRITATQLAEGMREKCEALTGKKVQCPVFIMANASKDRAFVNYFLEAMPRELPSASAGKA